MRQFSHSLLMDGLTFMEDGEKRGDKATQDKGDASLPGNEDTADGRRKADGCDTTNHRPRKQEIRLFFSDFHHGDASRLIAPGIRDDVAQLDIVAAGGAADPFQLDHHVVDGVPLELGLEFRPGD